MSTRGLTAVQRIRRPRNAREASKLAVAAVRRVVDVANTDVLEWTRGKPIPEVKPRAGTEVVLFDQRSDAAWREIIPPASQAPLVGFQSRSDVGYVALVHGEFAGWIWLSRKSYRDPWSGLRIRLAPDEAYSHTFFVVEAFRAQGVAALLVARMLSDVQADPRITRVYCWVDQRNRKSAFVLQMAFGFSRVQTIKRLHLLRRWGRPIPLSAEPSYGPLSAKGRHTDPLGAT